MAGLGRTSYLIVVLVAWLGVAYLFKENIEHLWVKMIGAVSITIFGCILIDAWDAMHSKNPFYQPMWEEFSESLLSPGYMNISI